MNESENPKVLAHILAENEYLKHILKPPEDLQKNLYSEMVGRTQQVDMSVPYKDNGNCYGICFFITTAWNK